MTQPKITIIIPIYNSEDYLAECLKSVIEQTYKNLEILLINDGSTDKSWEICKYYSDRDNRIIFIDKPNGGVSSSRNCGLKYATGDYVGFVDSDDYLEKDMYERLLCATKNYNADIAECGFYITDSAKKIQKKYKLENNIIYGNYECSYNYVTKKNTTNYNWNKLYRRSLFNGIRFPHLDYSEDYVVNVKVHYKCNKKISISGCYYNYRLNGQSAVNREFSLSRLDTIKAGKEIYKFHEERFSELCPFVALYILNYIRKFYFQVKSSNNPNKLKITKELLTDYRYYYSIIKRNKFEVISYQKKTIISLWLFSLCPCLYHYVKIVKL
ncbi:glycosyltransferase family 2 protein [Alteribacillus sp. YIM 98480]|uniref:glycosyltransferase family 2 protein n=1 Tax=Alteribacillus sp. YIM 98480 TaxID=2606599 RepID=UPI00131E4AEC|nr:glycosyltransferase family 2 protein [Alteribacillus sp. YIM 98480]